MTPEIKSFKFDDTCQRVYFYMNNKGNFIILDENENIIQDFFPPRMNMSKKCINIYNEYKRCNDFIDLEGKSLFFFRVNRPLFDVEIDGKMMENDGKVYHFFVLGFGTESTN